MPKLAGKCLMTGHYHKLCKVSQFYTSSSSTSGDHSFPHVTSAPHVMSDLPLIVLSVSKAECCTMSHYHHEIPSPTVDGKSLPSSLSLSSTDSSFGVCEVVSHLTA